jgi:hypothetical protein
MIVPQSKLLRFAEREGRVRPETEVRGWPARAPRMLAGLSEAQLAEVKPIVATDAATSISHGDLRSEFVG